MFALRSTIHFEFIFMMGLRPVSRFIFYLWMSNFSRTIYLKDLSFAPLSKISLTILIQAHFSAFYSIPLISLF